MSGPAIVESLMKRIRAEASTPNVSSPSDELEQAFAPVQLQPVFVPDPGGQYRLDDLLAYHDEVFVRVGFQSILRREPDAEGFRHFLDSLRAGASKVDILGRMRYSEEGRRHNTEVFGLRLRYALQRSYLWPIIGKPLRLLAALVQLPRNVQNQRVFESHVMHLLGGMQHAALTASARVHTEVRSAASEVCMLEASVASTTAANAAVVAALARTKAEAAAVASLRDEIKACAIRMETAEALDALRERQQALAHDLEYASAAIAERATRHALAEVEASLMAMIEARTSLSEFQPLRHKVVELFATVKDARGEAREALGAAVEPLKRALEGAATRDTVDELAQEVRRMAEEGRSRGAQIVHHVAVTSEMVEAGRADARNELAAAIDHVRALIEERAPSSVLNDLARRLETAASGSAASLATLEQSLGQKAEATHLDAVATQLRLSLESAHTEVSRAAHESSGLRMDLRDQERRLTRLLANVDQRATLAAEPLRSAAAAENEHMLDPLYVSLEERFRGAREDIRERQSIYLPYVTKANAGRRSAPVVDLGCGRGEWLELLREHDLVARGVDLNRGFLRQCEALGLDVVEEDAIAHLQGRKTSSIGAISCFHIVEHLPLQRVIALLDEAMRTLRRGGILLLETPNPTNLVVGACNFYLDPTHRNPLPPLLLQFLVEARGFAGVELLPLHATAPEWMNGREDPVSLTLNHFLFGAQDYGIVARKS